MKLYLHLLSVQYVLFALQSEPLVRAQGHFPENISEVEESWSQITLQLMSGVLWPRRRPVESLLRSVLSNRTLSAQLSPSCAYSLQTVADGLERQDQWAVEMLDASGLGDSGYMSRLAVEFGDYDQCLDINVPEAVARPAFRGQYCLFRLHFPLPPRASKGDMDRIDLSRTDASGTWVEKTTDHFKFFYYEQLSAGLCFPSSCNSAELEPILQALASDRAPLNVTFWSNCDTRQTYDISFAQFPQSKKLAIYFLSLMVSLMLISTFLSQALPVGASGFMRHFNAGINSEKLFVDSDDKVAQKLKWVHGARMVYLILVTGFHVGLISAIWTPHTHAEYVQMSRIEIPLLSEFTSDISVGISINFLIGGMLAFASWHPELVKSKGKLSPLKFVLGRWFRTFPLVLGVLVTILAFPMSWGSGPVWREGFNKIQNNCLNNWWAEFLYISNFLDTRETCLPHAWYLGADFQIYLTSFFILIALHRKPRVGVWLCVAVIGMGMIVQGALIHVNGMKGYFNVSESDFEKLITVDAKMHLQTFSYISPYYIGILLGFLVVNDYKIADKRILSAGWIFFPGLCFLVYLTPNYLKSHGLFTRSAEIIFGSVQRTLYSLGFAWGFFCGSNGQAGFLNSFLPNRVFVPLGRMSFSIFLSHFLFIWWDVFNSRQAIEARVFTLFTRVVYTIVCSIVIGYFLYLVFEAPFINLGKALFVKKSMTSTKSRQFDANHNEIRSSKLVDGLNKID